MSTARITMHGGAGTVTGSNFLFDTGTKKYLIDCGVEQGTHEAEQKNREPFAYDPKDVDALFVTHAHLDHIGRIPKLVHEGFAGTIYSTPATKDLAALIFEDSIHIMEADERLHHMVPLYARSDVERTLSLWKTLDYHTPLMLDDTSVRFLQSGHILGSAMVEWTRNGKKFVFTGDLGNSPSPLLPDAESIAGADYLLMESVYGDRNHEGRDDRKQFLRSVIEDTRRRKGVLLIPAFSIDRTQVILYELDRMVDEDGMKPLPIYLDAPLGSKVTDIYRAYPQYLNDEARAHLARDPDPFTFKGLTVTEQSRDSRVIESSPNPKVIIAGAGMSHGGRIRSHEASYISDPSATILFSGYQAAGSLGRRIQDGASSVHIDGVWHKVRAHTAVLSGYSGHKGLDDLVAFAAEGSETLKKVFVCMGEPQSALFLTQRLRDFVGLDAIAPAAGQTVEVAW